MTILFFTSEDLDMALSGIATFTGSDIDTNYVRRGVQIGQSGSGLDVNFDTSSDNFYISYQLHHDNPTSGGNDLITFQMFQGANEVFRIHPSNGIWRAFTFDGGAQLRDTFTTQPPVNVRRKITIQFHLAVSGSFTVWIGDEQVASFSGDTIGDTGATAVDAAAWRPSNTPSAVNQTISEIVVATEHTINMRVAVLVPNGEGNQTQWTNGFGEIDDITLSTADRIFTDTVDQVEMMNFSDYGGDADLVVKALSATVSAQRGATGPQNLQLGFRENVTEVFSSNKALTEVFTVFKARQDTNPDTSNPWTLAELDSMQAGVKSIT